MWPGRHGGYNVELLIGGLVVGGGAATVVVVAFIIVWAVLDISGRD